MEIWMMLYLWAALWCALIAARLPDAPRNQLLLVFGSIILGLVWPISLPIHLTDIPDRRFSAVDPG